MPTFDDIWRTLLTPALYFVSPERRVYWVFLVAALVLAVGAWGWRRSRSHKRDTADEGLGRYLFSREIWLHPSARLDYRLMVTDSLIRAVLFPSTRIPAALITTVIAFTLTAALGEPAPRDGGHISVMVAYSLALFIGHDLSRYLLHWLLHRVPVLWEFHKVHHSAEVLTPITIYRSHPVESFLYVVRSMLVVGVVTGFFFYVYRDSLRGWEVLGVNTFGFVFNIFGSNLRHSHVWLSFGRHLEHVFVSPAQHQLHHSVAEEHVDKNLGSWLAIWDWMFGTLVIAGTEEPELRFGLTERERTHDMTVRSAYARPFREAWAVFRQRR